MSNPMDANPNKIGNSVTACGIIAIVMGIFAMLAPGITGFSILFLVGLLVTLTGAARLVWAFTLGNFSKGIMMFSIGLLTLICGVAMLANPAFASGLMTILLTAYFIIDGIIEMTTGLMMRPLPAWGWLVFGGIISILLGIMIFNQYPLSGALAIGILFGIKMFMIGLIMIAGGSSLRQ